MSDWASNKEDKMLFENWRSYLAEQDAGFKRIAIFKVVNDLAKDEKISNQQARILLNTFIPNVLISAKADEKNKAEMDLAPLQIKPENQKDVQKALSDLFKGSGRDVEVYYGEETGQQADQEADQPTQPEKPQKEPAPEQQPEPQTPTEIKPEDVNSLLSTETLKDFTSVYKKLLDKYKPKGFSMDLFNQAVTELGGQPLEENVYQSPAIDAIRPPSGMAGEPEEIQFFGLVSDPEELIYDFGNEKVIELFKNLVEKSKSTEKPEKETEATPVTVEDEFGLSEIQKQIIQQIERFRDEDRPIVKISGEEVPFIALTSLKVALAKGLKDSALEENLFETGSFGAAGTTANDALEYFKDELERVNTNKVTGQPEVKKYLINMLDAFIKIIEQGSEDDAEGYKIDVMLEARLKLEESTIKKWQKIAGIIKG